MLTKLKTTLTPVWSSRGEAARRGAIVIALEQMGARIIGTVPTSFPDDPSFG